jgi:hypothetical protein
LVRIFLAFFGTLRFITVFTGPYPKSADFIPHTNTLIDIHFNARIEVLTVVNISLLVGVPMTSSSLKMEAVYSYETVLS